MRPLFRKLVASNIPRDAYAGMVPLDANLTYHAFIAAVAERIANRFDVEPKTLRIRIKEACRDSYGHTRIVVDGNVCIPPHQGALGGQIVWLRGHRTFRGVNWDNMPRTEDWEFLQEARAAFRRGDYGEVLKQYSYLRHPEALSPAQRRVQEIATRRESAS